MTISTSILAYDDCLRVLDQAVEAKNGARVRVTDFHAAIHFRMRLHQARKLTREENRRIYKEGDPQYGRSAYDGLVVRIKESDDECWVYLEKFATKILSIEEIADDDTMLQIVYAPERTFPVSEPQHLLPPPLIRRRI